MGRLRGVATQIPAEHKTTISVHCLAHCNLCLQDAAKNCHPIRNALVVTLELVELIKGSPKHSVIFYQCKEDISISSTGLRPLCPTRWTVRTSAIDAVLRNYPVLYESLEQITNESHDEYGRCANGVLALLQRFDTFFGLTLSHLVFAAMEQCSNALQGKNTTVQEALQTATLAQSFLSKQREDSPFSSFYRSTVFKAQEYNIEPVLPRYRRPPKHIDGGSTAHRFECPSDFFKVQYFEVLDLIQQDLSRRCNQQSLALPKKIEEMIINPSNGIEDNPVSMPAEIVEAYSQDVDLNKLQRQLQTLPDLVSAYKVHKSLSIFRVTRMRTISEMLLSVPLAKD